MTREVASDVLDVADSSDANSVKCARVSVRQQRCEKRDIKTNNTSACVTDMPSTMKPFVFDEPESENAEEAQNAEATRPKRYFWEGTVCVCVIFVAVSVELCYHYLMQTNKIVVY